MKQPCDFCFVPFFVTPNTRRHDKKVFCKAKCHDNHMTYESLGDMKNEARKAQRDKFNGGH